jgi:hypothetical protein
MTRTHRTGVTTNMSSYPGPQGTTANGRGWLGETRLVLLELHGALLRSEQRAFERAHGRMHSPHERLQTVLHHPWFSWLRELSGLIARIDEAMTEEHEAAFQADGFREEARALLRPQEAAEGFSGRYFEAIQRDVDVVLAHARATRVLGPAERRASHVH